VAVEVADSGDRRVVWSEHYAASLDDLHDIRARIVASLIAALEIHIPLHEARAARLAAPAALDAWANYHLGLQHVFRFTRENNQAALALFARAAEQAPEFPRAHAGLSFAHFQNAFLGHVPDIAAEAHAARRFAERAVELDALDPSANLVMGRALWLTGALEA